MITDPPRVSLCSTFPITKSSRGTIAPSPRTSPWLSHQDGSDDSKADRDRDGEALLNG